MLTSIFRFHTTPSFRRTQRIYAVLVGEHFPEFYLGTSLLAYTGILSLLTGILKCFRQETFSSISRTQHSFVPLPGALTLTLGGVSCLALSVLGILPLTYEPGVTVFIRQSEHSSLGWTEKVQGVFSKIITSWSNLDSGFWRYHVGARVSSVAFGILMLVAALPDLIFASWMQGIARMTERKSPWTGFVARNLLGIGIRGVLWGPSIAIIGLAYPAALFIPQPTAGGGSLRRA